jgi:hypothetical protein
MLILTVMATESAFAQRSVADDAVGGAAKGALIGAIAGDAGKGAAAGQWRQLRPQAAEIVKILA